MNLFVDRLSIDPNAPRICIIIKKEKEILT